MQLNDENEIPKGGTTPLQPPGIVLPERGEQISHDGRIYFLGEEIGEGYFGKVYLCSDRWANEQVAKVLLPRGRPYDQVRNQWIQELSNLVALRHPGITFAYDAFEFRSTFYLIVERCGSDLNHLLTIPNFRGDVWLPALARDLLQAIEFMHRSGYVHKDIHPGNVFVAWTRDRMVPSKEPVASFKIGDLGITRLERDIDVFNTMLAQWMLPPEAMDPNQFGLIGRTVDIYHAGLVFLSILLGRVPSFTREDIMAGGPRKMAEALPSIYASPVALALRRHVADRPQTAAQLWEAIVSVMPRHSRPL